MSVFTARGLEAKLGIIMQEEDSTFKVFIHLKDGESIQVRILSSQDFVEYKAHSAYNLGIYNQPCIQASGERCAFCEAAKSGIKEFEGLKARHRYLFAFGDMQKGKVRVFDATKGQAVNLIETIYSYSEDVNEFSFVFKRVGDKLETKYFLNPVLKLQPDKIESFQKFDGMTVEDDYYENILNLKSYQEQLEELKKVGFPLEKIISN